MSTEMASTFRRAAEVIRTGGLVKGTYEHDGAHCTIGALMAAEGVGAAWVVTSEIDYLANLLGKPPKSDEKPNVIPSFDTIVHWSDAYGRTADEVITLLEQAAEKLEADL